VSSSNLVGCRERLFFDIDRACLEAVVEAAQEAVEEIALCSSMSIAGETPTVVVGSSTGGEADRSEGPQIADRGQDDQPMPS
jgi:hypothetical protein